jgi:hypothetical protein
LSHKATPSIGRCRSDSVPNRGTCLPCDGFAQAATADLPKNRADSPWKRTANELGSLSAAHKKAQAALWVKLQCVFALKRRQGARAAAMRRPHHRSEGEMAIAKRTAKLTAKSAGTMPLPEPNLKAIMSGIEIAGTEAIRAPFQAGRTWHSPGTSRLSH